MKKVLAVNSDPRKHSETAQLLEASLEGAREAGAQTRMIQLYDLSFSGCIGCASCKRLGHPSYNKCILKDDLTPILQELRETDVVILGTPLMFAKINGDMQNFLERWFQPENTNEPYNASMWPRVTRTALYLTTYQSQAEMLQMGYQFPATGLMKRFVGDLHVKLITDTMQFPEDSNNYYAFQYDAAQRKELYHTRFQEQLQEARQLAKQLTELPAEIGNPYREQHIKWYNEHVLGITE